MVINKDKLHFKYSGKTNNSFRSYKLTKTKLTFFSLREVETRVANKAVQ